jgi:predicted GNAT family N-acyltransferase
MRIYLTTFEQSSAAIRAVRDAVFGDEQHIPRELDWDGRDDICRQALAVDDSGNPIGTGRMLPDGRIGRIAVLAGERGRGIGSGILAALVRAAAEDGIRELCLHAQALSIHFYETCGFRREGEMFMEAGIPHVTMKKSLP